MLWAQLHLGRLRSLIGFGLLYGSIFLLVEGLREWLGKFDQLCTIVLLSVQPQVVHLPSQLGDNIFKVADFVVVGVTGDTGLEFTRSLLCQRLCLLYNLTVQNLLWLNLSLMVLQSLDSVSLNIEKHLDISYRSFNLWKPFLFNDKDPVTHGSHCFIQFCEVWFQWGKPCITGFFQLLVVLGEICERIR